MANIDCDHETLPPDAWLAPGTAARAKHLAAEVERLREENRQLRAQQDGMPYDPATGIMPSRSYE